MRVSATIAHSPASARPRLRDAWTRGGARAVAIAMSEDFLEFALRDHAQIEKAEADHERRHDHTHRRAVAEPPLDEGLDVDLGRHDVGVKAGPGTGGEPDIDEVVEGPEG